MIQAQGPNVRGATGRRRLCSAAVTAAVILLAASGLTIIRATPASAVGDPTLSKLIIADPEPGWSNLPTTETANFETQLQTEFQHLESQNQTFSTAVGGWQSSQGASEDSLAVFLVESIGGPPQSIPATRLAFDFCTGATNVNSVSTPPIPNVPNSAIATCSDTTEKVTVGTATKGNFIELIASFGLSPLTDAAVERVVGDQLVALPGSTTSTSPVGGIGTANIVGAAISIVVVVGGAVAFVLLRRRRSHPATAGDDSLGPDSTIGSGAHSQPGAQDQAADQDQAASQDQPATQG